METRHFIFTTEELLYIRKHYCNEINYAKVQYGNKAIDYINYLEKEIHNINLELLKRGE